MKHFFTRLLSILSLCAISISAMAQEAYAVMSKDSTTLTFYYDNKKASREGTAYKLNLGANIPEWVKTEDSNIFYITDNDNFTTVVFDGSFKDARPISCAYWFSGNDYPQFALPLYNLCSNVGLYETAAITNRSNILSPKYLRLNL